MPTDLRIFLCDYELHKIPLRSEERQAIVFADTESEARTLLKDSIRHKNGTVGRVEELLPLPRKIVQLESALTSHP